MFIYNLLVSTVARTHLRTVARGRGGERGVFAAITLLTVRARLMRAQTAVSLPTWEGI